MGSRQGTASEQEDGQDKFGVGDGASHCVSPFTEDFKELLSLMSTKKMLSLMSTQQKNLAKALWEAENYGGRPKPGDLKNVHPKRDYYELVLLMEHQKQWEDRQWYCKQPKNC